MTNARRCHKYQGSFKQVTTDGSVRGDPILLLTKNEKKHNKVIQIESIIKQITAEASVSGDDAEMSPQRLYSRFVAYHISQHQKVPLDASDFYMKIMS